MKNSTRMWAAAAVVAGVVAAQSVMAGPIREYGDDLIHNRFGDLSTQRGYTVTETAREPVGPGEVPGGGSVGGASAWRGTVAIESRAVGRFDTLTWFQALVMAVRLRAGW